MCRSRAGNDSGVERLSAASRVGAVPCRRGNGSHGRHGLRRSPVRYRPNECAGRDGCRHRSPDELQHSRHSWWLDPRHGAGSRERRTAGRGCWRAARRRYDSGCVPHDGECDRSDGRRRHRRAIARVTWLISPLVLLAASPWVLLPPLAMLRVVRSRSLAEDPPTLPPSTPLVSIIVPARNEARNIGRCVRSILATPYAPIELIVVDDHSTDGTSDVARAAGGGDARLRILANPTLPNGWFGKQWACTTGAAAASGSILIFTDADTMHAPDLL